jgi:glutathione S-transferase
MSEKLTFYTNPRSRGAIVHWMLEEVGCRYTVQVLEFDTSMKAPSYLAINPLGKVPAIQHGEQTVTEAAAICTYLAETFPAAGLLPALADRGAYYRWLFFTVGCLEPAYLNHANGWIPATTAVQRALGYGSYERVLDAVSSGLRGRTHIAGERFSAADLLLASHLNWGMLTGAIEKRGEFVAYCEAHTKRPAALRAQAQAQELVTQAAQL